MAEAEWRVPGGMDGKADPAPDERFADNEPGAVIRRRYPVPTVIAARRIAR
jgi:hypothetical protein